ncbi:MAG: helix-turn-helix domain-containing protein [Proteobacteria bacterium]|nr:helix-turn-helix domain-containing protein [Pseudomonadota bacterium]
MAGRAKPARDGKEPAGKEALDVTVVLLEEGYASTAVAPIEVFHAAGVVWNWFNGTTQRPRFRVQVVSLDGRRVRGLCGLDLTPKLGIDDIKSTDIIIVSSPGWHVLDSMLKERKLLKWLRGWHKKGAHIAGVCTGVAFLAQSGLLDGRVATTHWGVADEYRQRFPKVRWRTDRFVTEDDRILCSGGVYAAIDVSLYLVEKFCGREIALQCAKALCVGMPRSRQSGYAALRVSRPHSDEKIRAVEEHLQANFCRNLPIGDLAGLAGMGPRNFIRRFKAATGHVPGAYIQTLRISAAKDLLETGALPVQSVSAKVGYEDIAFFRQLFRRHTGMSPVEYRGRFARMGVDRGETAFECAVVPARSRSSDA